MLSGLSHAAACMVHGRIARVQKASPEAELDARRGVQVDLQAQARVHRLGQTKQVMVAAIFPNPPQS